MEKILILYYTGTNNTKYIVNQLNEKLKENYIVNTINILEDTISSIFDYHLLILCYPIYAFNAPKVFEKYIEKVNIRNTDYLIIKDSGEGLHLNDASSNHIYHLLKHKECHFINEYHLLMPYNIMFRHKDNMVKQMLIYNDEYLNYIISSLSNTNEYKPKLKYKFMTFIGKLQRVGAFINGPLIHNIENCNNCNLCVLNCPTKALSNNNGKIKGSTKCIMCMRCSFNCPKNAIKMGLFNNWKINKPYDFNKIINDNSLDGNYLKEASKKFYKYYHKYYEYLNNILNDQHK